MNSRRGFLKGTAWMGAAAALGGCQALKLTEGGKMQGFTCAPLKKVRVGVVDIDLAKLDLTDARRHKVGGQFEKSL